MHLFRVGEVLPVLAGPGLLDLWEHPGVRGRLCGPGGLHHPEVLHPVSKCRRAGLSGKAALQSAVSRLNTRLLR